MILYRYIKAHAILSTFIVVVLYFVGFIKTQSNFLNFISGWWFMAFILFLPNIGADTVDKD